MSIPYIRPHRSPRTNFKAVCGWLAEKKKKIGGVVTAIGGACYVGWRLWQPIGNKLNTLNETAAATQSLRVEIDTRAAARDKQFNAITDRLEAGAEAQQETTKALAVTNARLDGTNTRLDDTNKRLDIIIPLLRVQARAPGVPKGEYVTAPAYGPPAPGREQ